MTDLLSRLSAATGPSRELDAEIALAAGWAHVFEMRDVYWRSPTSQICPNVPRYTESIDAALTLVPEGMYWVTGHNPKGVYARVWTDFKGWYEPNCATPAIALVVACLKAKEEKP